MLGEKTPNVASLPSTEGAYENGDKRFLRARCFSFADWATTTSVVISTELSGEKADRSLVCPRGDYTVKGSGRSGSI